MKRKLKRQIEGILVHCHFLPGIHANVIGAFQGWQRLCPWYINQQHFCFTTVASRHFRSLSCHNIGNELIEYHEDLPGYQDIFGSLNYMGSNHCDSIFGPAAYFLDMMRIIDDYIIDFNSNKPKDLIPAAWYLAKRRPDLFEMKLDCANTNNLIPYLQVVNEVIERRLTDELKKTGSITAIDKSSVRLKGDERLTKNAWKGMQISLWSDNIKQTRLITGYDSKTKNAAG